MGSANDFVASILSSGSKMGGLFGSVKASGESVARGFFRW